MKKPKPLLSQAEVKVDYASTEYSYRKSKFEDLARVVFLNGHTDARKNKLANATARLSVAAIRYSTALIREAQTRKNGKS